MCRMESSSHCHSSSSTSVRWGATTCTPSCHCSRMHSWTAILCIAKRHALQWHTWHLGRFLLARRTPWCTCSTMCGPTSSRRALMLSTLSCSQSRACAAALDVHAFCSIPYKGCSILHERYAKSTGKSTTISTSAHRRHLCLPTLALLTMCSTITSARISISSSEMRHRLFFIQLLHFAHRSRGANCPPPHVVPPSPLVRCT
mmetsp:Transcript_41809/g.73559  ORF Transcript_41809/g.73559 Transcript_41809/m.73559 type:complete len:202 (-) Transcript_41809:328-933(-)